MKGVDDRKLPSFMTNILNRSFLLVVISFVAFLPVYGCSTLENPSKKANDAIAEANKSISEHNKLVERAHSEYADVKKSLDSGGNPSKEVKRIGEIKSTFQKARGDLSDARDSLNSVQDMDVNPKVKKYTRLLSSAIDDQLAAESKEIEFYGLLQEDPTLKHNRDQAQKILSQASQGYESAAASYQKAQKLANANPKLITPPKFKGKQAPAPNK